MSAKIRFAVAEWHVSPWDAHLSRALLESEGVPAFLENEHHVTANWPMSRMLGGVRLMVPVEYIDAARAAFALRDRGDLQAALEKEYPPDIPTCCACGSTVLSERRDWVTIVIAVVLLLKTTIIFPPRRFKRCAACGEAQWQ
ncbi:MAG: DUF2007 domain-containing protein [Pseudomonadota bacterium]